MSQPFFTSDLHFGHQNIIKYCNRPYKVTDEMDQSLIENWNGKVGTRDKIFILGDVFFCDAERAGAILRQLNGEKHLILGNHDKLIRKNKVLQGQFEHIYPDLHQETIDDMLVIMCHFPLLTWERQGRGSFMLHGHCHNTIPFDPLYRRMDVGVDAQGMTPIAWEEIKQQLLAVTPKLGKI